jgi:murein endopeptidase
VREFDAVTQWWLLKRILQNPFGCVKAIFLDRKHIRSLEKVAKHDVEWALYHVFIRHMPGHKNHFHVRIGNGPGKPGCVPGANPESEDDFEFSDELDESEESDESAQHFDIHEQLNQSLAVPKK